MVSFFRIQMLALALLVCACSSSSGGTAVDGAPDARPDVAVDGSETSDAGEGDAAIQRDVRDLAGDRAPDGVDIREAFETTIFDRIRIASQGNEMYIRRARGEIDFGDGPFQEVALVVNLESTCFPFSKWADDPPPAGHNWPPKCDAFDRNFEFTMAHPEEEGDAPAVELVRAITPFGGPMQFEVDITDVANGMPGQHDIDVKISTWSDGQGRVSGSDGGWYVSASVRVVPGPAPRNVLRVIPLWNGSYRHDSGTVEVPFSLQDGEKSARLEYRTTGHGGASDDTGLCIGPAEEFCRRNHFVSVSGRQLGPFVPWIESCEAMCTLVTAPGPSGGPMEYCQENPCGSISSVRAPRANWCPGAVTPPMQWDFDNLGVGDQNFQFSVNEVRDGGSWRTSAMLVVFGDP